MTEISVPAHKLTGSNLKMTTEKAKIPLNTKDPHHDPDGQASEYIFFFIPCFESCSNGRREFDYFDLQKKCPGHAAAAFGVAMCIFLGVISQIKRKEHSQVQTSKALNAMHSVQ